VILPFLTTLTGLGPTKHPFSFWNFALGRGICQQWFYIPSGKMRRKAEKLGINPFSPREKTSDKLAFDGGLGKRKFVNY
jgi:hypothetical protein